MYIVYLFNFQIKSYVSGTSDQGVYQCQRRITRENISLLEEMGEDCGLNQLPLSLLSFCFSGSNWPMVDHSSFMLNKYLCYSAGFQIQMKNMITECNTYYTFLPREHMIKIQNQHLSRQVTSNQVLTIPLHLMWFCRQLENTFSSSCALGLRWVLSLP